MAATRFFTVLSLLAAAGCAFVDRPAPPTESFDASTGESLAHPAAPTTFVAERPGLSVIGRDYLRVSPVTVSGRGAPVTWLWCALSSSIDRELRAAKQPAVDSIVLLVDDVPMSLTLEPWSEAASASPYSTPAGEERNFAARVTQSQLDRIVASTNIEAWVVAEDAPSSRYALTKDSREGWLSY